MSDIDKLLDDVTSVRDAFKTPDGYFDNLTERIMSRLPEENRNARIVELHKWTRLKVVAASVCAAIVCTGAFMYFNKVNSEIQGGLPSEIAAGSKIDLNDDFLDQAADYMMFDNKDVYNLLADE